MHSLVNDYLPSILISLSAMSIISLLLAIWAFSSNASLRRRVRRWQSIHETADLEELYRNTLEQVETANARLQSMKASLDELRIALRTKVSTPRVMRFNAFSHVGSDLSYSVALLDENGDGVVLSSIFGRDESRTYAKPIHQGESEYALTDEEREVIDQPIASKSRKPVHV